MNCSFCGAVLMVEVARCPSCGTPTPDTRQATPEYNPAFGAPQSGLQQPQTTVSDRALDAQQPYQQQAQTQAQTQAPYANPGFASTGQPQMFRGPAAQNIFPPLSIRQSGKQLATPGDHAPQQPTSKLSDYKTVGQSPDQPGKISDYKQPSTPRSKLSDYKPTTTPTPASAPAQAPLSSTSTIGLDPTQIADATSPYPTAGSMPGHPPFFATPTTGLGAAYTANSYPGPTLPAPGASYAPSMPPIASNHFNQQVMYSNAPQQEYNPVPQVGEQAIHTTRQGKRSGLLPGGIAIALLILCVAGASIFLFQRSNNKDAASLPKVLATPVLTVAPVHGPSGNTSVPAISALFSEPRMASALDDHNKARQVTESFSSKQTIYVTFTLNSKNQNGYVKARWYKGKQLFKEVSFAHDARRSNGYFSIVYEGPTTDGSVELYWSTTADFGDARLARVAHFTVNA